MAKDFFDTDVTVDILDVNQEEGDGEEGHVVFLVVQKSHGQMRRAKPKGSQDSQDSREVERYRVWCVFQKAQFLWERPVSEQLMQRTESIGPSKSGVRAGCFSLSPADILDQIILRYDGWSCGNLAASLDYPLDDSGTQLSPTTRGCGGKQKASLGTAKCPPRAGVKQSYCWLKITGLKTPFE